MFVVIYTAGPTETQCLIIKITMKYLTLSSVYSHIILRTYNCGVAYIISPSSSELNLFTLTFDLPLPEIFHRRKRGDKVICVPEITALHNRKLTEALKTAIKLQNKETFLFIPYWVNRLHWLCFTVYVHHESYHGPAH